MKEGNRFRIRVIAAFVLLFATLYIVRLYYLQVAHGEDYAREAEKQYVATVPNLYDRGTIYFKEKDGKLVAAATISSGYLLAIAPDMIADPAQAHEKLKEVLPLDREEFIAKAAKKGDPYEVIAERVPEDTAERIRAMDLDGVSLYRETWRYYPGKTLAAQTLGFVGFDAENVERGRYGLERTYDDVLSRKGHDLYVNFFAEIFSNLGDALFDRSEIEEGDIVLTIEPSVQSFLESELAGIEKEWNSDSTGGIVMDPNTGAILAMASFPTFDPNTFNTVTSAGVFGNPIVEDLHEMGSTVKPLTVAAGLDAGVITANSTYDDPGRIVLDRKTISNFDGRARGPGTTMQEVLNQSLNTGVAHIAKKLGNDRMREYFLERFKLGEETGVDLPGEVQGLTANLQSKRDVEYATASFGQGIAVTPVNVTVALASLGNGGYLVTPYVLDEIRYESGRIRETVPNPGEQILKKETSDEISRMLVKVVDTALLNGSVKVPEYSIAAKTGTAQMARPRTEGGGYYDDRYLHTFFGYFPAYDPKFIVFLYTENPKDATFASHTLTHPFMRTAKFLLHYYEIPPDRDPNASPGFSRLDP